MVTLKRAKGCLKKTKGNMGHCPKRWEGFPIETQIFNDFKLGQRGNEGVCHDYHIPNAAHQFSLKRD